MGKQEMTPEAEEIRYPCRVTEKDWPALHEGQPPGVAQVHLYGKFTAAEFQAAFPGLDLRQCLYQEGTDAAGPYRVAAKELAAGNPACFVNRLAGLLTARQSREEGWPAAERDRLTARSRQRSRSWSEMGPSLLLQLMRLAREYPEVANPRYDPEPRILGFLASDAWERYGMRPQQLVWPEKRVPNYSATP